MNQTEYPSLQNSLEGFEFKTQEPIKQVDANYQELEISCINLLSKLENVLAKAIELEKDDFIDEAAEIGRVMLSNLSAFTTKHLAGEAADQAADEIGKAETRTYAYEHVLQTRPFVTSLVRAFWNVEEKPEIVDAHQKLGDALARASTVALYHTVSLIGPDSEFGQEIDQSTVLFVEQFKASWGQ